MNEPVRTVGRLNQLPTSFSGFDKHAEADGAEVEMGKAEGVAVAVLEANGVGVALDGFSGFQSSLECLLHGESNGIITAAIGLWRFSVG